MKIRNLIITLCAATMLSSCFTPKTVAYFPELEDGRTLATSNTQSIVLKPADKLSIVVNTKSAELNNVLNMPVTSQIIGYTHFFHCLFQVLSQLCSSQPCSLRSSD